MSGKVKVGIIGSQFQAECHCASIQQLGEAMEVVAVASPTKGNAERLARRHGIPRLYTDYREMLRDPEVEMISITAPNRLHARMTIDAARAGKHVVCEKPLCVTLEEADAMIDACAKAGVLLLYAEELFFAPKYVKAKQMADEGAFGAFISSSRARSTPARTPIGSGTSNSRAAARSWTSAATASRSAGGSSASRRSRACTRSSRPRSTQERTRGDDEAFTIIEFEGGTVGMVENSWTGPAGWTTASKCSARRVRPTPTC